MMAGRNETGSRFTASLVIGVLLVPVSAVAAFAFVARQDSAERAAMSGATATEAASSVGIQVPIEPVTATDGDLAAACGEDGLGLVSLETTGEISDVQQAALDALRQVCEETGLPLAGPPAPPPVFHRVTVAAPISPTPSEYSDDDDDDDHDDDHDDDDHDDDDDDHDDDDDEDHDDEDHDDEDHD
jgi:hypothetical protein